MTINAIWIGQLLGVTALAATANANTVMFLAFATVFGFSMATTVKMGIHFGGKNIAGVRKSFGTGTGFSTGIAIIGAVLGWVFSGELLDMLSTPPAIHDLAYSYLHVSFLAMPFSTLAMMVAMGLRAGGDAKTPFYAMIVTTIGSIVLNPLLILGIGPFPEMGIAGSALSLAIANLLGALVMIGWVYFRDLPIRLRGRELFYLVPRSEELGYILAKGVPMGTQMLINSSAALIMIGLVNREGLITVAAYAAILQLWSYIQMPSFAISTAITAMVAQNIGAGLHGRVGRITIAGLAVNGIVTGSLYVMLVSVDSYILPLFLGAASPAIPVAEHIQLLATWAWVLQGLMVIMLGTLRGYGVVMAPLIIVAVSLYPVRLGFYYLAYPTLGADALWLSYGFGAAIALGLTWLTYSRGAWRRSRGLAPAFSGVD
ncbi:MAG: MATE family efflux transporter [Sphingomonadaceae bacterium]|nr:MATE family efflux transporter [Sphingomonadaceae bacterium]